MYPLGSGYRNTVDRVGFLAPHPNLDHPRIILNEFANCLPAQAPDPSEIAYAVVPLESRVFNYRSGHNWLPKGYWAVPKENTGHTGRVGRKPMSGRCLALIPICKAFAGFFPKV